LNLNFHKDGKHSYYFPKTEQNLSNGLFTFGQAKNNVKAIMYHWLLNNLPRPLLIRLSYIFRIFSPILYSGNDVTCPVCEKSFSKFLGYGSKVASRKNALCPNCLSLERHRLLWLYLHQKTNFFEASKTVLHIAPEQCFHGRFKKLKNLEYVTGDLYSPLAEYKFDLHDIPFEDNKFDVILCNHVLEHVKDDHRCMTELHRVLKPGGFAILQVPIDYTREHTYEDPNITSPEDREKHYWQKDHLRLYGLDYSKKLEAAGFKMKEEQFVKNMKEEDRTRYRLQNSEIIYRAEK
jgi:SAM-dependent methyltransferase